jgi:hypothetical protein
MLGTDTDHATQYRNTGGAAAGFFVTPWFGPSIVTYFTPPPLTMRRAGSRLWALIWHQRHHRSADNSEGNLENGR